MPVADGGGVRTVILWFWRRRRPLSLVASGNGHIIPQQESTTLTLRQSLGHPRLHSTYAGGSAIDAILRQWFAVKAPQRRLPEGLSLPRLLFDEDPLVLLDVLEALETILVLSLAVSGQYRV